VYETSVQPLVQSFLGGFNSSILAYGQTGSGKTYTMGSNFTERSGDGETLGVIPRVVEEVLAALDEQAGDTESTLQISFLEVYNEQVRDLLRPTDTAEPRKGYQFHKDAFGNYDVRGLTHIPITDLDGLAGVLSLGASRRTTAATQMNATSSRSHAVFTMRLEQTPLAPAEAGASASSSDDAEECEEDAAAEAGAPMGVKRVSLFRLVDLAGSERSKKTKAEGERLREAGNINQSLSTLGRCISALATKAKHVPFRQSKLTQLLSNSLGGNSATLMIACVSPADSNFDETCITLKYAQQAASIRNTPVVNADPAAASAVQLRHANQDLRNELARLFATGAGVDPSVLSRHGIAGAAAPSPCPGRRAVSRMPRDATMPVGSLGSALSAAAAAHTTAEHMRSREELAAAGADIARLEGELEASRAELAEMSERGRWAVEQAGSLLDETTRLATERDEWRWRYETLAGAFAKLEGSGGKAGSPAERVAAALKEAGEAAATAAVARAHEAAAEQRSAPKTAAAAAGAEESKDCDAESEADSEADSEAGPADEADGEEHDDGEDDEDDDEEEGDEEEAAPLAPAGPTEHDVRHIKSQMELRGQLQQVSDVLRSKQQLLRAMSEASGGDGVAGLSVGDRFQKLKADFQSEMRRSESEVTTLEDKMRDLAGELEQAKREAARARDEGEREAKAHAASEKDGVLKALRSKVTLLQRGMKDAERAQKRRERELTRIQALQQQIESHKREKVKLEKTMRESGRKYLDEKKAHDKDRAQAAKRERTQALALRKYQQELQRQGRALETAKQRVRTLKKHDEMMKGKQAAARKQRRAAAASSSSRAGGSSSAASRAHGAAAAAATTATASPAVQLPLRAAAGQSSRASRMAALHDDLLTDTSGLPGDVARLIERAAAEAAGSKDGPDGTPLQESVEVGEDVVVSACDSPRGVDGTCRSLVSRALYYRIQASGWRAVAQDAVEKRAAAAKELHAVMQGASARASSSSSSGAAAADGPMTAQERRRADGLRREMVSLTLRVQHAQAQTQSFAAALEAEGLHGSGWIRRAAAETPLRSKARTALAGRLLSWFMELLVGAQTDLYRLNGAKGAVAATSAAARAGRSAGASLPADDVREAVDRAERALKQELWRAQCEAAAAQREDAERVAALQVQLVQARAEAAKGGHWGDATDGEDAEGAAGGDGKLGAVVGENRRLRQCIAEMEAMLGEYCDKSAAEADSARDASETAEVLVRRVASLEEQLDAERRRAHAAASAPRRLSIVTTSPAPKAAAQASARQRRAAAAAAAGKGGRGDALPSVSEISAHLTLTFPAIAEGDDDVSPASSSRPSPVHPAGPTSLQHLILTTTERRASTASGAGPPPAAAAAMAAAVAAERDTDRSKRPREPASSPASSTAAAAADTAAASPAADASPAAPAPAVEEASKRARVADGEAAADHEEEPAQEGAEEAAAAAVVSDDDSGSDDESEFAGRGAGFEALTAGGDRTAPAGSSVIASVAAQQAVEGRALRSRRSKYITRKGFGSAMARGAPEHGTRVEERRREALALAGGVAPARVTVALPPAFSAAAPPRPPTDGPPQPPKTDTAQAGRQARARLAQFLGDARPARRRSSVGIAEMDASARRHLTGPAAQPTEEIVEDKENAGVAAASGKAPTGRQTRSRLGIKP